MPISIPVEQLAADLAKLRQASERTLALLAAKGHRLERLQCSIDNLQRSLDGMTALDATLVNGFDAVFERLERLEVLKTDMRSETAERLGAIERRLERVEQRLP